MRRLPLVISGIAGAMLVATGLWALIDPMGFYDAAATYPPYNEHLLHDIGAFLVGLGSALLLGLRFRRALTVALVANAIGAVLHAVSHIVDRDHGGKSSDPLVFTAIAVVLVLTAAQSLKETEA